MKIAAIKKAVTDFTLEELQKGEQELLDQGSTSLGVDGEDEGEVLTHIIAAIEIKKDIDSGTDEKQALRNYTQRVRKSIS